MAASPNFNARRGGVRPSIIVLHYTAMSSCAEAYARLCDPEHEVSAHWLISETGAVYPLVDEAMRAWHAGAGVWAGLTDINSHSIGIELANAGNHPFSEPQMVALETLLREVMARWDISPHKIIAHSDMAPSRKSDPGPHFDWQRLARQGLSIWPKSTAPIDPSAFWPALSKLGYPDGPDMTLLTAFRLRFRPWGRGPLDGWDAAIAQSLAVDQKSLLS